MKSLIIDCNILLMSSVFVQRKNKGIPLSYFILRQIVKHVKEVLPDRIYLAADKGKSWRRAIYPEYKATREGFRESFPDIDWEDVYNEYNKLLYFIQDCTSLTVIQIESIEGDDTISYLCRYLKGEKRIITKDKDIQQLLVLPEVSLLQLGRTKDELLTDVPADFLYNKIHKGDKSDNIKKSLNFPEEIRNEILMDLMSLPSGIDSCIHAYISNLKKSGTIETFIDEYGYKSLVPTVKTLFVRKDK